MRDITDNLKKACVGLTLLALTSLPLSAQKRYHPHLVKPRKPGYYISRPANKGIRSPPDKSKYLKSDCFYRQPKKTYSPSQTDRQTGYCVSNEEKKFERHFHKMERKRTK